MNEASSVSGSLLLMYVDASRWGLGAACWLDLFSSLVLLAHIQRSLCLTGQGLEWKRLFGGIVSGRFRSEVSSRLTFQRFVALVALFISPLTVWRHRFVQDESDCATGRPCSLITHSILALLR